MPRLSAPAAQTAKRKVVIHRIREMQDQIYSARRSIVSWIAAELRVDPEADLWGIWMEELDHDTDRTPHLSRILHELIDKADKKRGT